MKKTLVGIVLVLSLVLGVDAATLWAEKIGGTLFALERDLSALLTKIGPSVVTVEAGGSQPPQVPRLPRRVGSGVVWDRDGGILTAASVLSGGERARVTLRDGRELEATVVGQDDENDLALLHVEAKGLDPIPIGDSDRLRPGAWVTLAGNSYGLPTSVSFGVVNGVRKDNGLIQIGANISPGNSGGPVLDTRGQVVGIVTSGASSTFFLRLMSGEKRSPEQDLSHIYPFSLPSPGVALAIPINRVKSICDELKARGKVQRGYLGVQIQKLTPELAEHFRATEGVLVSDVLKGTPADDAGLRDGDIILEIAGKRVRQPEELRDLVSGMKPGTQATLKFLREGKTQSVRVTLGEAPPRESELGLRPSEIPEIRIPFLEGKGQGEGKAAEEFKKKVEELQEELKGMKEYHGEIQRESLEKAIARLQKQMKELQDELRRVEKRLKEK